MGMTLHPDAIGATETAAMIARGTLTVRDAVDGAIGRIEALDGPLNAVPVRCFDRARAHAEALDAAVQHGLRAPLLGVPMTVKESYDVAGLPTTWGLAEHARNFAARDSEVVRRLKAAGAVIIGKTNVPPLLADWQSDNPVYGRTVNPHNQGRSAGGSSGGSAVAVATGMVPVEMGSDIGGSIRVPANFNGIMGHKPTFGLVPLEGHEMPGFEGAPPALSVGGPFARSAADLALMMQIVARHPLARRDRPVDSWRVVVLDRHPVGPLQGAIREALGRAGEALARTGAEVLGAEYAGLPDLARHFAEYAKMLNIAIARGMPGPDGEVASVRDWFDILDTQERARREWRALFEEVDFVLAPSFGMTAFAHTDTEVRGRMAMVDGVEVPMGMMLAWPGLALFPCLPATALPLGMDAEGLPIGAQLIGPEMADLDCIAAVGTLAAILRAG